MTRILEKISKILQNRRWSPETQNPATIRSRGIASLKGLRSTAERWIQHAGWIKSDGRSPVFVNFDLQSVVEEEYQRLRNNLALSGVQSVAIVSSRPKEGATTVAALLAFVAAKTKDAEVVLIDANLRSPALHQVFSMETNSGLVDFIMNGDSWEKVLHGTQLPNLFFVSSGSVAASPFTVFEGKHVEHFLRDLKKRFQLIICDLPPLDLYEDACLLCPHMDGVVLVIEADKTPIEVTQRCKKHLERSGARIVGTVLNKKKSLPAFLDHML